MKASELIKKLQEQIELHGDCELWLKCLVEDYGWNGYYTYYKHDPVELVDFSKKDEHIYLEAF